jgi:RNA polymerase sigma-70 factor (ECF subfamily)
MGPADMDETIKLVERVKNGDRRAFWDLMSIYEEMIFRFCYRILLVKEVAEDIARDTFLKAFDKIRDLKDNNKFKTWLFSIANNKCMDELKRSKKYKEIPEDDGVDVLQDEKGSPEEISGEEERKGRLIKEINRLDAKHKEVVLLVHYEGLSYEETAEVLNVPVGTVRSRLSRGLFKLQGSLHDLRG